ncbi:MAG: DNA-binding domain-containing protein [Burkholderiales bacterium]
MPSLRELQLAFADALDRNAWPDPGTPCGDGLTPRDRERFPVYANNVATNLIEALRAVYPVVEKLVGGKFFAHAAREYVRAVPSVSGDLHRYGRSFPQFLARFDGARPLVYLPDTARLEWLMHETFHAADQDALDLTQLGRVAPDRVGALVFCLHPACRLLRSPYPVHRIWQVNQPDAHDDERVDLGEGGVHLLIARPNASVEIELVSEAEFSALTAMAAGADLTSALADAQARDAGFDAGQFLRRRVLARTLVDFRL